MKQEAEGDCDRIAKALAAHIPAEGHEWLACLAAYLADCPAEEAEKLAQAIQSAKAASPDGRLQDYARKFAGAVNTSALHLLAKLSARALTRFWRTRAFA
jgi:hypothetical protein